MIDFLLCAKISYKEILRPIYLKEIEKWFV